MKFIDINSSYYDRSQYRDIHLQNYAMMHEPINGCGGNHWVFEYLFPLGKRQVASEHDGAPLISLSDEHKQDLHLFATLRNISNGINDN